MLLLEQDITKKERIDEIVTELEFDANNSEEYAIEAIWDSTVYVMESESSHLPRFYYLVAWKGYAKKKNTWETFLAVQYLGKLIRSFYKDHFKKPIATSPPIKSAPPMARLIVKLTAKSI